MSDCRVGNKIDGERKIKSQKRTGEKWGESRIFWVHLRTVNNEEGDVAD
jgi:hypothetical protein